MDYINEKLVEFNNYLKGRKVAVIGLGVSNIPLIDYLHDLKSDVTVFDGKEIDDIDKKLIIKDVFKGRLKKDSDDGNKYILYVLDENTETFERYTMFLTIDKENLPDYLLKYVQ